MSNTIGCGTCDGRWGGARKAHCSGCHETFSTVGNFDRHRYYGQCVDPASRGLVLARDKGGYRYWRMPGQVD